MSAKTKIAWSNTATYDGSSFTNPSYALTPYKKQLATTTATDNQYSVNFSGNCLYVSNTDATSARCIVTSGTGTQTITADTTLTVDTYYGSSLNINDNYSLTISDGDSMYVVNGTIIYNSGDVAINDSKLFEFSNVTNGTATVFFTNVSYLGLLFTGSLGEYGEPEYPLQDDQVDFGFQKRTINGTTLYSSNYISNDISFNLFSTLSEYKSLRENQRNNRNNVLCVISNNTSNDEYYTRYGFLNIVNGQEERGQYYSTPIKLEGV